jgi:uncharacterized protein YoxC
VQNLWQWALLLAAIGFFVVSLVLCYVLIRVSRSLWKVDATLGVVLEETRRTLPEVRHTVEQIDDMVTEVNDKFMAADRAMTATAETVASWGTRIRERFTGLTSRLRRPAGGGKSA